jgi:hypothetical protein
MNGCGLRTWSCSGKLRETAKGSPSGGQSSRLKGPAASWRARRRGQIEDPDSVTCHQDLMGDMQNMAQQRATVASDDNVSLAVCGRDHADVAQAL